MIDLYSFRNWLLRLLAGGNSVIMNVNINTTPTFGINFQGNAAYASYNVTFNKPPVSAPTTSPS